MGRKGFCTVYFLSKQGRQQTNLMSHFRFLMILFHLETQLLTHARLGDGLPTELNLNPYWCKGEELREAIFDGDFIQVV